MKIWNEFYSMNLSTPFKIPIIQWHLIITPTALFFFYFFPKNSEQFAYLAYLNRENYLAG